MELCFVTRSGDKNGEEALEIINTLGKKTARLGPDQVVEPGQIVLFSPLRDNFHGSRGRLIKMSAIKLTDDLTPEWARSTPFRVAVIRTDRKCKFNKWVVGDFSAAVREVVNSYAEWLTKKNQAEITLPWNRAYKQSFVPGDGPISQWFAKAKEHRCGIVDPQAVLASLTRPQDPDAAVLVSPIKFLAVFCPNVSIDRSHLVSTLEPGKVKSFLSKTRSILRLLADQVASLECSAVGPDFLDYPDVCPLLHPKTLAQEPEKLRESLIANWQAFQTVIKPLEDEFPGKVTLDSIGSRFGKYLPAATLEVENCTGLINTLVSQFQMTIPHYAAFDVSQARARVRADLILYLATARLVAADSQMAILGVEVSDKYWIHLWPYLKKQGIAPRLYWLPKWARQHFSFVQED